MPPVSLPIVGESKPDAPVSGPPKTSEPPKKVYFVSLGCPKNQVDTEVMLGVVREGGHELVDDPELADTLVVNTCGFIDAAKEESIDTILALAQVKAGAEGAEDLRKRLVVTGCLSQRYPEQLAEEIRLRGMEAR